MFQWLTKQRQQPTLKEQVRTIVQSGKDAAGRAVEHVDAMVELFTLELQNYIRCQVIRACLITVALLLLIGSYFILCALISVALHYWLGWLGSLGTVLGIHILLVVILLLIARKHANKQIAPQTVQELKKDWECLKLLTKGNSKS